MNFVVDVASTTQADVNSSFTVLLLIFILLLELIDFARRLFGLNKER